MNVPATTKLLNNKVILFKIKCRKSKTCNTYKGCDDTPLPIGEIRNVFTLHTTPYFSIV